MIQPKLVIIHGPAGAGKSTVTAELRRQWAGRVAYVEQDVFSPGMLGGGDEGTAEAIVLVELVVSRLLQDSYDVVLEGIFNPTLYSNMIANIITAVHSQAHIFYLETSVQTVVNRHNGRAKAQEFPAEKVIEWYPRSQKLGHPNEIIIETDGKTAPEVVLEIQHLLGDES